MKKIKIFSIIILILALMFFAGLYIYKDFKFSKENKNIEEKISRDFLEEKNDNNTEETDKIKEIPIEIEKIKIPDLFKLPVVKANLPEDVKNKVIAEIQMLTNSLKNNYDSPSEWIQLGLLKKTLGDFEGAKAAWEFVSVIRPKDSISRHNLGNLYWQNLKDLKKAEENYLEAIALNKQDIAAYVDLSNIYFYDLKNKIKAKEILNKGLKNNPENEELKRAMEDMNL